jgi:hypothetical protein
VDLGKLGVTFGTGRDVVKGSLPLGSTVMLDLPRIHRRPAGGQSTLLVLTGQCTCAAHTMLARPAYCLSGSPLRFNSVPKLAVMRASHRCGWLRSSGAVNLAHGSHVVLTSVPYLTVCLPRVVCCRLVRE